MTNETRRGWAIFFFLLGVVLFGMFLGELYALRGVVDWSGR